MKEPIVNSTATAELFVTSQDLASALSTNGPERFPKVFATSRMVALMEIASARLLQPFLADGELSVGVSVDVIHSAPTPPGVTVTAVSRYVGRLEKFYLFEVTAADSGGEIGRARHKRAIISVDRLEKAAKQRCGSG